VGSERERRWVVKRKEVGMEGGMECTIMTSLVPRPSVHMELMVWGRDYSRTSSFSIYTMSAHVNLIISPNIHMAAHTHALTCTYAHEHMSTDRKWYATWVKTVRSGFYSLLPQSEISLAMPWEHGSLPSTRGSLVSVRSTTASQWDWQ